MAIDLVGNCIQQPIPIYAFFTPQRAPDGQWFGDELPPSIQDYLNSPNVKMARDFTRYQILTELAQAEQRRMIAADPKMRKQAARNLAQNLRTRVAGN